MNKRKKHKGIEKKIVYLIFYKYVYALESQNLTYRHL